MKTVEQKQMQINNRNYNANIRNATVSQDTVKYSQVDLSHSHFTSFNSGYAVPVFWDEVLPGDIWKIKMDGIIRMSTPATNTMTNPIISINFFYVSSVSIWSKWKQFFGENNEQGFNPDVLTTPYYKPNTHNADVQAWKENDLFCYLGMPVNVAAISKVQTLPHIQVLPNLGYGKIWNDWYRDQNLDSVIDITITDDEYIDFSEFYKLSSEDKKDFHKAIKYGFTLAPASKLPDYFTTCLPYQQKGLAVSLPTDLSLLKITGSVVNDDYKTKVFNPNWYYDNGAEVRDIRLFGTANNGNTINYGVDSIRTGSNINMSLKLDDNVKVTGDIFPTINDLRNSITLQHYLELDARYGTRYNEYLFAHWGIVIDPLDINKSLIIGSYECPLKISNVIQTSSSTSTSPLGSLAGVLQNYLEVPTTFEYAASQHGFIYGIVVVRTPIFYSQGLSRKFTRKTKYDYYDDLFKNISDQPVYNYELYLSQISDNTSDNPDINVEQFGFQEPFADYRTTLNKASGYLSANSSLSLKNLYLYGETYSKVPKLNSSWMNYNSDIIKNTLFVSDDSTIEFYNQFIANFNFDVKVDRKVAIYVTPGVDKV